MKKAQITSTQLMLMAVGSALVFPYTFMPIHDVPPANQDVWIVLLLSFVYILILNAPLLFLINKCRGLTLNQMADAIMGRYAGKIVIIPFILFFVFCYTACMLITAEFSNIYFQTATPIWAFMVLMAVGAGYAAYKGAGAIGRLSTFFVTYALVSVVAFVLMGIDKMDMNELFPILGDSSFWDLNLGAFLTAARYSEILIFFVFSQYLRPPYSVNKTYVKALALFGIGYLMILIPTITVLGVDYAKLSWNPYYTFSRQVSAFGFLERVQTLNILAWFPMAIFKLSMYLFMASHTLSNLFKAKTHKKFVIPVAVAGLLTMFVPFLYKSSTLRILRSDQVFPYVVIPVIFLIPCLMVIVYLVRRKKAGPVIKRMQQIEETLVQQEDTDNKQAFAESANLMD